MKYGSLNKDDIIINFDDELDIVSDDNNSSDSDTTPINENNSDLENPTSIDATPHQHKIDSLSKYSENVTTEITHHVYPNPYNYHEEEHKKEFENKPIVIKICYNIELTVPQVVSLFFTAICLEYLVLSAITS